MERFKIVIKRRMALLAVCSVLALALIVLPRVYISMVPGGTAEVSGFIYGFQVGISVGLEVIVILYTMKYAMVLKNENKLKALYVEENDERTKLIHDKIGGAGFNFALGAIATATVVAGFFNQTVFMTLLGVLVFIVLVKGSLKVYYRNKF